MFIYLIYIYLKTKKIWLEVSKNICKILNTQTYQIHI